MFSGISAHLAEHPDLPAIPSCWDDVAQGFVLGIDPDKQDRTHDQQASPQMIPAQFLVEVSDCKQAENQQRDDLLSHLELNGSKLGGTPTVGRDLKTIFKKRNQPADQNGQREGCVFVFEVAIPREGHKKIGNGQQKNRPH